MLQSLTWSFKDMHLEWRILLWHGYVDDHGTYSYETELQVLEIFPSLQRRLNFNCLHSFQTSFIHSVPDVIQQYTQSKSENETSDIILCKLV